MTEDSFAIDTQYGRVRGFDKNGMRTWLGIPYARAARFEAPQAAEPWSGVRDAVSPAPMCPQGFGGRRPKVPEGVAEDCLTVNIWAPPADGRRRPVMFWIHGGAFMAGGANQYDGQEFARLHDIVVVGINYRVGVLGFVNFGDALGLPSIPSNLGLRDQIAALRWVHDNVGAFGGDPTRVTIVGQSAGSMSVSLLMLCKEAWPYFRGAVLQSGALNLLHDREKSIFVARGYAEKLGLNQGSLEKLRALDVNALLDAQGEVQKLTPNGIPASPWYDGELLPDSYIAAQAAPVAQVPIMAGATRQEVRLFDLLPGPRILPTRRADIEPMLRHQLPQKAEAILRSYPESSTDRSGERSDLLYAHAQFRRAARAHPAGLVLSLRLRPPHCRGDPWSGPHVHVADERHQGGARARRLDERASRRARPAHACARGRIRARGRPGSGLAALRSAALRHQDLRFD